jgi:DNA-binding MarR family transcriptional regulator
MEEMALSHSQVSILDYIARQPDAGIQEIAQKLDLATPTVSVSVRQLETGGWLQREPDPEDGRAVRLSLTSRGKQIHRKIHGFRRRKFEILLSGIAPPKREQLLTLLEDALNAAEQGEKEND